ncbi:uncharacterized protein N7511_000625 [Penicillium nucicola]|uniref:uncharacterized protein n=1 Tax=Penicillium nucicola TaxID=1850975 RepID=UPI0025451754|nr:uncharacterized protein N7511_000625 [Penicillium nucicola]KAJ5775614.1 hypothetical protein N7511_000625 [Penicillium nucicola]
MTKRVLRSAARQPSAPNITAVVNPITARTTGDISTSRNTAGLAKPYASPPRSQRLEHDPPNRANADALESLAATYFDISSLLCSQKIVQTVQDSAAMTAWQNRIDEVKDALHLEISTALEKLEKHQTGLQVFATSRPILWRDPLKYVRLTIKNIQDLPSLEEALSDESNWGFEVTHPHDAVINRKEQTVADLPLYHLSSGPC